MYERTDSQDSGIISRVKIPNPINYKSRLKISLMCMCIAMSMFLYGYWMTFIQQFEFQLLQQLYSIDLPSSITIGLLNGCVPVGALIGALFSSVLINKFSRRTNILFTNFCGLVIGGLIFVPNFTILVACRICQGICIGIYSALTPLMIRQMAPKELAGSLGSYVQMSVSAGAVFGTSFSFVLQKITGDTTGSKYWRILAAFPQLVILTQTLILIFIFPYETPKYWLIQGQEEQARKLLQVIYRTESVEEILQQKKADLQTLKHKQTIYQLSPSLKRPKLQIIMAINTAFLLQLSGVNTIIVYGGKIAKSVVTGDLIKIMPILINLDQLIAIFFVSFLLVKHGRRLFLVYGTLGVIIANGLVAVGFLFKDQYQLGNFFVICGVFLFMADYGLSIGAVSWLYISEVAQPKFMPVPVAMNWIGASIVVILFPIITDNLLDGNPAILFFVFMAWCTCALILNSLFMVETKGKTEQQIREEFEAVKVC